LSSPNPPSSTGSVSSDQAWLIAPSLKYWPKEKLPAIWKKVLWRVVMPTSSMSRVRTHFWMEVAVPLGNGGFCSPRK